MARDPLSACTGKTNFPTFDEACRAARRIRERKEAQVCAYHCEICGYFHVGTRSQPYRKTKRPKELTA